MEIYKDIDHDSGVYGYEINADSITVWFKDGGKPYVYSYGSAGQLHIENMKELAVAGDGLNSYINRNVRFNYVR